MAGSNTVVGDVAQGWGGVADAFSRNLRLRGDVGAALSVVVDGRCVVDLWGGLRDPSRRLPWQSDTMVPVFSTTKGVTALVVAWLRSQGRLDWDRPVAQYWPQFAQAGKQRITVRQLMAHEAGLTTLDTRVPLALLSEPDTLATILAAQRPRWSPGERSGYHAITLGLYQNELARRVDRAGRTIGRILAEEFAGPLGLDLHVGLPAEVSMDRIAVLGRPGPVGMARQLPGVPLRLAARMYRPGSATARVFSNPQMGAVERASRRSVLTPESPSTNGVATARSLARLYGAAAIADPVLPIDADVLGELSAPLHRAPRTDAVLLAPVLYSHGFSRPLPSRPFGSPRAYGTPGLGGSFAFADPDRGLGYAWTPNALGVRLNDDPREVAVRRAVERVLG